MKQFITVIGAVCIYAFCAQPIWAEEYEVGQKDKAFSTQELTIKTGDIVNFKNNDTFFHNIFSLSDAATFDLGSYPKGEFKGFKFDAVGVVEVECAIHPDMQMTIKIE